MTDEELIQEVDRLDEQMKSTIRALHAEEVIPRIVKPEEAEKWADDRFAPELVRNLAYTVCKLREFAAINAQAYDEIQAERNQLSEALKKSRTAARHRSRLGKMAQRVG